MNIIVNGRTLKVGKPLADFSYDHLAALADRNPAHTLTVTYSLPDGRCGDVIRGQRAPVVDGAVYNVGSTGAA